MVSFLAVSGLASDLDESDLDGADSSGKSDFSLTLASLLKSGLASSGRAAEGADTLGSTTGEVLSGGVELAEPPSSSGLPAASGRVPPDGDCPALKPAVAVFLPTK